MMKPEPVSALPPDSDSKIGPFTPADFLREVAEECANSGMIAGDRHSFGKVCLLGAIENVLALPPYFGEARETRHVFMRASELLRDVLPMREDQKRMDPITSTAAYSNSMVRDGKENTLIVELLKAAGRIELSGGR